MINFTAEVFFHNNKSIKPHFVMIGAINISAEENSENVTISVSDDGIGIAPADLKKLFDISEVLTTTGTAKETGIGI